MFWYKPIFCTLRMINMLSPPRRHTFQKKNDLAAFTLQTSYRKLCKHKQLKKEDKMAVQIWHLKGHCGTFNE